MAKITYTNKVALSPQPSIADINKVTDDDMNEIKSVVNTNDDNVGDLTSLKTTDKTNLVGAVNELKDGEIYSKTEVKTNKVWIDNKPIYRKVIETTTPSSTNSWVAVGNIANLSTIINIYGFAIASNGRIMPINFPEPSAQISTSIVSSTKNIEMKLSLSNWQNASCYIICEYTKSS